MKIKDIYKRLDEIEKSEQKSWDSVPGCGCSDPSVAWLIATKIYGCNSCGSRFDSKGNKIEC